MHEDFETVESERVRRQPRRTGEASVRYAARRRSSETPRQTEQAETEYATPYGDARMIVVDSSTQTPMKNALERQRKPH